MSTEEDPYIAELRTIGSAQFAANGSTLLMRFVGKSPQKAEAARYVLDRISEDSQAKRLEDTLLSIKGSLLSLASNGNCYFPPRFHIITIVNPFPQISILQFEGARIIGVA